ncbi:MAG: serine/threonine protein kinase, partial [Woeseiaceae bacterium]
LGRLVARIHLEGQTRRFEHRPTIDIYSYGVESLEYLLDNDFIPEDNRAAYESVAELVLDGVEACFERSGHVREIRLHGDFHPGNVLVARDQLHIVDLDDARHGPAVQDLWMFLSGDRDEQTPQLTALLEGYQSFRPFDARELHLVEALRSLRIMHYAAWLARRWEDPAFKIAFPWFDSRRYWDDHVLALREQVALMQEPPLEWRDF